jgi:FecR protein
VGLPAEQNDGLSTTIMQQAGSILLEVEKRNVKHFAVETPYLAAVVKGTQFNVTVKAASTSVEVHRGQVEVSDFKSGQIAQVMPGQVASTFEHGKGGLSLSGSGTFNPIEQGKPRASSIERVRVPKSGLSAPRHAAKDSLSHEYAHVHLVKTGEEPVRTSGDMHQIPKSMRISAPLGEVRLNFQKVTNGLARNAGAPGNANTNKSVWSNGTAAGESSGSAAAPSIVADVSGSANQSANGNGGGVGNSVVSNGGGIGNNGGSGNGVVSNGGGVGNNGGVGTGGGNGTAGNGGLVGGLAGGVVGGVGKLGSGGNLGNGVVSGLGGLIGGLGIGGSKH